MHYYYFKIGDYIKSTSHLTPLEDIAYRRMLDRFYDTEEPLPCEIARIAKLIRMPENQAEIREVLNEFWEESEAGWVNIKAQEYLDEYHSKASTARANGKKGGRPKNPEETQSVILANPDLTQQEPDGKLTNNQEPITNNQIKDNASLVLQGFNNFWLTWSNCKKEMDVKNTSSKSVTLEKFKNIFNKSYFENNPEQGFKSEIESMCKFAEYCHSDKDNFNPYKNMQTGKFLTSKGWRD